MNYYEIGIKSTIANKLLDYAFSSTSWFPYYNFSAKPIPPDIITEDNFFKWLHTKYEFLAGVIKLDPYTCYNWHKDTRRGVGINMLLTPHVRSVCVFADDTSKPAFKIEELKYKPITYYIFNTQNNHTVYNFESTRFLLSIDFLKNKDELIFNQLVDDVKEQYEKNSTE